MQDFRKPRKILFLYTEPAGYLLACLQTLAGKGIEVHLVKWPVNNEAPFKLDFSGMTVYNKDDFKGNKLSELCERIKPDIIFCSGWNDKDYLSLAKKIKKKTPVVLGFDNHWKGTLKQWMGYIYSSFTIRKYFTHCWIPGKPQEKMAMMLGFKNDNILKGLYCADYGFFHRQFLVNRERKKQNFPKRFLFAGRYYSFKGIEELWNAFIQLQDEQPNEWELWCIGTGDIKPVSHSKIKHFGFVQPDEMERYIKEAGVLVMPSHFEPWGVVLHEFTSAGFPVLCSDKVGAGSQFLQNNVNGYSYLSGDLDQLKKGLKKFMDHSDVELNRMSEKSAELASANTPDKWAETLTNLLSKQNSQ